MRVMFLFGSACFCVCFCGCVPLNVCVYFASVYFKAFDHLEMRLSLNSGLQRVIFFIIESFYMELWNRFVCNFPGSSHCQILLLNDTMDSKIV